MSGSIKLPATTYYGSKGAVAIAGMPYPHLKAARDKLARSPAASMRSREIEAMTAELARRDAEYAARR
jgi:hypothetical protein